jgi:Ti-type conjugative transfer relaxase TraA
MLSMSAMSSGQASYYLGLAREDYYLQGGEPPGQWFGRGAEVLGLSGQVESDHLYNLFDGLSPRGDISLVQRQNHEGKAEHRPGWDLTFSAPKSVSTMWSQADEETRSKLQRIQDRAVKAALGYLQDTAASTRRGREGKRLEEVGLVAALFEHSTSRALDPQLHTHALIMNVSVRDDGTTGTLSSLDLFLSKMAAGALYRAELAKGLQVELGLILRRERTWFEIEGVSKELVQEFSKRREAIEEQLAKSGLSSAEAAAVAAIQTRTAKDGVSRAELFQEWRREGERLGWSADQVDRLIGMLSKYRSLAEERQGACERATERLTWDEAFFSERDFVRYVAEESQGRGLGAKEVRESASRFLNQSPEIVRLGLYNGEQRFTTRKMMELESELLSAAAEMAKNDRHQLHAETVMGTFAKHGGLSEEQLQAVWHITRESGAIAVVSGMAGTGKTRMLDVAREAWESEGYRVEGAALAARAAKELKAGSDIESATIARTLMDIDRGRIKLDNRTILVVDEAGMVATPDMRRLSLACRDAGAKLVLVGDERQLQPIGPGAPFLELGERFGRAELTDIRRQSEEWARQAVRDMADGNARDALHAFAEHGLVTISSTRREAMGDLVAQWRADGEKPENTLILAGTRNEVRTLNELAQAERIRAGELGADAATVNGERIFLNDRVMFTKNKGTLGIENGAKGTVCGMAEDGTRLSVWLDSGEKVTIQPHAFPHISLGYAATTHKAQGATTLKAYVLGGGPMQGRELSYVQASRARLETRFFATAAETGDDIAQLAREMERSRQKLMAHTVIRQQEDLRQDSQSHDRRRR